VFLQRGHGGNQRAHAGRNAHGRGQNVIHHQRGGGQQSGPHAQVFAGDRVRSAALRIRHDGLAVGEVYDGEQDDDAEADGYDVSHPSHSQRNQERQGRFRPVGGGAERIQAENGNALAGRYPFGLLFLSRQRAAQQQIREAHGPILPQYRAVEIGGQNTKTATNGTVVPWSGPSAGNAEKAGMVRPRSQQMRQAESLSGSTPSDWGPVCVRQRGGGG
jgi:hypothetical protein